MTHKKFIEILENNNIRHKIEDGWLVVMGDKYGDISLSCMNITSLPEKCVFKNKGRVYFAENQITTIPETCIFENGGGVYLEWNKIKALPENYNFKNQGDVDLSYNQIAHLPENCAFQNKGEVVLKKNKIKDLPKNYNFQNKDGVYLGGNRFDTPRVGKFRQEVIIFRQCGEWRVQLGTINGNKTKALTIIAWVYGKDSNYYKIVKQEFGKMEE